MWNRKADVRDLHVLPYSLDFECTDSRTRKRKYWRYPLITTGKDHLENLDVRVRHRKDLNIVGFQFQVSSLPSQSLNPGFSEETLKHLKCFCQYIKKLAIPLKTCIKKIFVTLWFDHKGLNHEKNLSQNTGNSTKSFSCCFYSNSTRRKQLSQQAHALPACDF